MNRVRNAIIIIILCIIGAGVTERRAAKLNIRIPVLTDIHDAVAGHRVHLTPPDEQPPAIEDMFHESGVQPRSTSNTLGDIPPPPRGQGGGEFSPLPQQNAPELSPSGPRN
jgi:hypothetical protein